MAITPEQRLDPDSGSHTEYKQDNDYTYDSGLVVMPVLGLTPKHRVIRLHSGVGMRTVTWRASRTGAPPIIPAAVDTDGDKLLGTVVTPVLPAPNEQAKGYNWLVTGEYTFVQTTPRIAGTNAFPTGNYPYIVSPQCDVGADLIGSQAASIIRNNPGTDVTDQITELAVQRAPVSNGVVTWPFTVLPAAASSTHLIT